MAYIFTTSSASVNFTIFFSYIIHAYMCFNFVILSQCFFRDTFPVLLNMVFGQVRFASLFFFLSSLIWNIYRIFLYHTLFGIKATLLFDVFMKLKFYYSFLQKFCKSKVSLFREKVSLFSKISGEIYQVIVSYHNISLSQFWLFFCYVLYLRSFSQRLMLWII